MLLCIVVVGYGAINRLVIGVVMVINVVHVVAVVVILHIGMHVSLVVPEVVGTVMSVVAGVVIPVVGRAPVRIVRPSEAVEEWWAAVVHGLDDIVDAIDIG